MFILPAILYVQAEPIHLRIDRSTTVARFDPRFAFGAGVDGHEKGEIGFMLNRRNVAEMKGAGLQSLTYRLRTELAGEAWHWNPQGTWSDQAHRRGYWTSSSKPGRPILRSYGYRLPRRGNTIDQANNDGYSMLDDGDVTTFWKSNPNLDSAYGGPGYDKQPQWIVLDLKKHVQLDTAKISWGAPYAKQFRFDRWVGSDDPDERRGSWEPFPKAEQVGAEGTQVVSIGSAEARYVRIQLLKSSNTAPKGSRDRRDSLGFAIREIGLGHTSGEGAVVDEVKHGKGLQAQTTVFVSSTDPWHRAEDLDPSIEQPGFDLVWKSGLTSRLPVLVPTGALYDTPDNVEAEMRWLKARAYPIRGVEIGEEPDGQCVAPEDYAALYLQIANRIKRVFPHVAIGGPSFQTVNVEFSLFPNSGEPWLSRFIQTLSKLGRSGDFNFCSFEWYPFDDVRADPGLQIPAAPELLEAAVSRLRQLGAGNLPMVISEYGLSAFGARAEVDLPGAIFNMDCALSAVKLGRAAAYLYGYEANELIEEIPGAWGNNMILQRVGDGTERMPTYYGAKLLTRALCLSSGTHRLLACSGEARQVGCYPLVRPDGRLAVALLNRSATPIKVSLEPGERPWRRWQYSSAQYRWHEAGEEGRPSLSKPPLEDELETNVLELPGYSITVLVSQRQIGRRG